MDVSEPVAGIAATSEPLSATPPRPSSRRRRGHGLNPRREAFCRHYVACGAGTEAAQIAGYNRHHARNQAHRLLRRPDVQARIVELRFENAIRESADLNAYLAKLDSIFQRCVMGGHYDTALRALAQQARLSGFERPRQERAPTRTVNKMTTSDDK